VYLRREDADELEWVKESAGQPLEAMSTTEQNVGASTIALGGDLCKKSVFPRGNAVFIANAIVRTGRSAASSIEG
jgi:hypothetical protein